MSMKITSGVMLAGRYRVGRKLGEGGMGTVYLAHHETLKRDVALKVLLPRLAKQKEARARFEREARVSSRLRHPNAVEIYDFGEDHGLLYIAMARLRGVTLDKILKTYGGALPLMRVYSLGVQLADVLAAAHRLPLVHRDIKPENIFIEAHANGEERVVVVDFGLAFISGADQLDRMTRAGEVFGSPPYLSPEQAQGLEVGPASDVYSLGCMLYELVCGVTPFKGEALRMITQHVFSAPEPPSERSPGLGIPKALEQLIMRMLRKAPEARPSAEDVLRVLTGFKEGAQQRLSTKNALAGRAARMVSLPPPPMITQEVPKPPPKEEDPARLTLGLVGEMNGEVLRQMRMNQIYVKPGDDPEIILALGAPHGDLQLLHERGKIIIADAEAGDMAEISALLRLGVAEVVSRPIIVEDLIRKIRRVKRKLKRRRRAP